MKPEKIIPRSGWLTASKKKKEKVKKEKRPKTEMEAEEEALDEAKEGSQDLSEAATSGGQWGQMPDCRREGCVSGSGVVSREVSPEDAVSDGNHGGHDTGGKKV